MLALPAELGGLLFVLAPSLQAIKTFECKVPTRLGVIPDCILRINSPSYTPEVPGCGSISHIQLLGSLTQYGSISPRQGIKNLASHSINLIHAQRAVIASN